MIDIDIDADLNMVDDDDRNYARVPAGVPLAARVVAVAGRPGFWSWVEIEEVSTTSVYFRQITAAEAATHGDLAVTLSALHSAPYEGRTAPVGRGTGLDAERACRRRPTTSAAPGQTASASADWREARASTLLRLAWRAAAFCP